MYEKRHSDHLLAIKTIPTKQINDTILKRFMQISVIELLGYS